MLRVRARVRVRSSLLEGLSTITEAFEDGIDQDLIPIVAPHALMAHGVFLDEGRAAIRPTEPRATCTKSYNSAYWV